MITIEIRMIEKKTFVLSNGVRSQTKFVNAMAYYGSLRICSPSPHKRIVESQLTADAEFAVAAIISEMAARDGWSVPFGRFKFDSEFYLKNINHLRQISNFLIRSQFGVRCDSVQPAWRLHQILLLLPANRFEWEWDERSVARRHSQFASILFDRA